MSNNECNDKINQNNIDNHTHNRSLYTIYENEECPPKYIHHSSSNSISFQNNQVTTHDYVLYKNDTNSINTTKNKHNINNDFIIKHKKDILHTFRNLLYDVYIRNNSNNNTDIHTTNETTRHENTSISTQHIFEQFVASVVCDIQHRNKNNEKNDKDKDKDKNKNAQLLKSSHISKDIAIMSKLKEKKPNALEQIIDYKKKMFVKTTK